MDNPGSTLAGIVCRRIQKEEEPLSQLFFHSYVDV